ncbi:MAG TPA: hypothetical protein VFM34_09645 [Moraxellaceae bacterium]|nr:hypothetical protein [Moraxellaceae bacterium]
MKLSRTLAAVLFASVAGLSFAAEAPAPVTGATPTAQAPAKAPAKKAVHHKHHGKKKAGKKAMKKAESKKVEGATPAAK